MLFMDMVRIFQAYKKPKAFIATQGESHFFTGLAQQILEYCCEGV